MSESQPFKNYYNEELAWRLGRMITQVYPAFPVSAFVAQVRPQLPRWNSKNVWPYSARRYTTICPPTTHKR